MAEAGLPCNVVPGITAASGCAAYAGIPLTHRDLAGSVTLVTARRASGQADVHWADLANPDRTVVFYMASRRLETIADKLTAAGRSPKTPVAVVENGTSPDQRVIVGELATIAQRCRDAGVTTRSVLIVGEVVTLATDSAGTADEQEVTQPARIAQ